MSNILFWLGYVMVFSGLTVLSFGYQMGTKQTIVNCETATIEKVVGDVYDQVGESR